MDRMRVCGLAINTSLISAEQVFLGIYCIVQLVFVEETKVFYEET